LYTHTDQVVIDIANARANGHIIAAVVGIFSGAIKGSNAHTKLLISIRAPHQKNAG
jgi:hypothetical protein